MARKRKLPMDLIPDHFPPTFTAEGVKATDPITLGEARGWLRDAAIEDGDICLCCGSFTKYYDHALNRTMAACMMWIAWTATEELNWVDIPNTAPQWIQRSKQYATLRHWKLVEDRPNVNTKTKGSGIWRPTPLGRAWSRGEGTVPKYAVLYRGETIGNHGPDLSVQAALKEDTFDYAAVMQKLILPATDKAP